MWQSNRGGKQPQFITDPSINRKPAHAHSKGREFQFSLVFNSKRTVRRSCVFSVFLDFLRFYQALFLLEPSHHSPLHGWYNYTLLFASFSPKLRFCPACILCLHFDVYSLCFAFHPDPLFNFARLEHCKFSFAAHLPNATLTFLCQILLFHSHSLSRHAVIVTLSLQFKFWNFMCIVFFAVSSRFLFLASRIILIAVSSAFTWPSPTLIIFKKPKKNNLYFLFSRWQLLL